MTYSPVKRKKASQLAVMLATPSGNPPSHAIESIPNSLGFKAKQKCNAKPNLLDK